MKKSAGALITYDKKILMLLRDNNQSIPNPDCWQLIGGDLEAGESPVNALIRETKEEANLSIQKDKVAEIGKIIIPKKQEYFFYWIKLDKKQVKEIRLGNEGQRLGFISAEELEKVKLGKNLSNYFHKYQKGIEALVNNGVLNKRAMGFDEKGFLFMK